jgi:hypothetical protein
VFDRTSLHYNLLLIFITTLTNFELPLNLQVHLRLCCLWQELQITNKEVWMPRCSWGKLFIFNVCFNSNKLCYHHLWNQVAFTLKDFLYCSLQDVSLFQSLMFLLVLPPWRCYSSLNVSTKSGISYVQFTPLHIVFH